MNNTPTAPTDLPLYASHSTSAWVFLTTAGLMGHFPRKRGSFAWLFDNFGDLNQ